MDECFHKKIHKISTRYSVQLNSLCGECDECGKYIPYESIPEMQLTVINIMIDNIMRSKVVINKD